MSTIIGYDNILLAATVTASTEAAGHPVQNAYSGRTMDYWQGSGASPWDITVNSGTADYLLVYGNGIAGLTLTLSVDTGGGYSTVWTATPSTDAVLMPTFGAQTGTWRLRFAGAAAPRVAAVMLGQKLVLPRKPNQPFLKPRYGRQAQVINSETQGGQFAGRSVIYTLREFDLGLKLLTNTWIDANWDALYAAIVSRPFGLLWDSDNHASEAALCWLKDANNAPQPKATNVLYSEVSLPLRAIV